MVYVGFFEAWRCATSQHLSQLCIGCNGHFLTLCIPILISSGDYCHVEHLHTNGYLCKLTKFLPLKVATFTYHFQAEFLIHRVSLTHWLRTVPSMSRRLNYQSEQPVANLSWSCWPCIFDGIWLCVSRLQRLQDFGADYSGQDKVTIWMQGHATRIDLFARRNPQRRTMEITETHHPPRRRQNIRNRWPSWWPESHDSGRWWWRRSRGLRLRGAPCNLRRWVLFSCFPLSPESDPIRIKNLQNPFSTA